MGTSIERTRYAAGSLPLKAPKSTIPSPDSSIATKTVTSRVYKKLRAIRPAASRGIGLMLVVFIAYSTTVNAAHRHGRLLSDHPASVLTTQSDSDDVGSARANCSDCLICQLHQSFSTSLISTRPYFGSNTQIGFHRCVASVAPRAGTHSSAESRTP